MTEPWRINFPVLREPWTGEECLIIYERPIADARGPAYRPTMCYVVGHSRTGKHYGFSVPIALYDRARRAPAHFLQVDNIQAPSGVVVDVTGQPFVAAELGQLDRKAS